MAVCVGHLSTGHCAGMVACGLFCLQMKCFPAGFGVPIVSAEAKVSAPDGAGEFFSSSSLCVFLIASVGHLSTGLSLPSSMVP